MASDPVAHLEVSPEANKNLSDQYLNQLLQQCPDTASATKELKRLSEHAFDSNTYQEAQLAPSTLLAQYVDRRSQGEPLEYIHGQGSISSAVRELSYPESRPRSLPPSSPGGLRSFKAKM